MKRGLLTASLCLNLALGLLVCWRMAMRSPQHPLKGSAPLASGNKAVARVVRHTAPGAHATGIALDEQRSAWASLESEDYPIFVANLRAIGCPEETIADIIAADLEKSFAFRAAALPETASFWASGPERESAERAKADAERELQREKETFFASLCGSPWPRGKSSLRKDLTVRAIYRFLAGPVADAQLLEVISISEREESSRDRILDSAKGLLLPEDEERLSRLREESREDMRRVLTPAGYQEFTARIAATELMDKHEFRDFEMSGEELRQICRLYNEVADSAAASGRLLLGRPGLGPDERAEFHRRLEDYLGAVRFARLGL